MMLATAQEVLAEHSAHDTGQAAVAYYDSNLCDSIESVSRNWKRMMKELAGMMKTISEDSRWMSLTAVGSSHMRYGLKYIFCCTSLQFRLRYVTPQRRYSSLIHSKHGISVWLWYPPNSLEIAVMLSTFQEVPLAAFGVST